MLTLKKTVPSFSVGNTSSCFAAGEVAAGVVLEVKVFSLVTTPRTSCGGFRLRCGGGRRWL
jgi:CO dehydrogenase/acetyl-CoA synthase beta subunit